MERVVDVTAARRQLGTLLDEVYHKGDVVTIKRKGKPLAKIVPLGHGNQEGQGTTPTARQQALLEQLNSLPRIGMEEDPVEILRRMRKQKRIAAVVEYGE